MGRAGDADPTLERALLTTVNGIAAGLRSACTYAGARTLDELFPITIQVHSDAGLAQPLGPRRGPRVGPDHLRPAIGEQASGGLAGASQADDQIGPHGQERAWVVRGHGPRVGRR